MTTSNANVNASPTAGHANAAQLAPVGILLREWRTARRLSQLDLALDAGVSARHLSYIETGKSQPSREMLTRLADTLEMSLRERNALLIAAGYAPKYPESALATPEMAQINRAIDMMLKQQEPYPAFLMNRHWDILAANDAAVRMNGFLLGGQPSPHRNMLRHLFDPNDLRAALLNWEEVAGGLLAHLHNLVAASPGDGKAQQLVDEANALIARDMAQLEAAGGAQVDREESASGNLPHTHDWRTLASSTQRLRQAPTPSSAS